MDYLGAPQVLSVAVPILLVASPVVKRLRERLTKHLQATPAEADTANRVRKIAQRQGRLDVEMDEYEQVIAPYIINYEDINEDFSSVGGLDDTIRKLRLAVTCPLTRPELYKGRCRKVAAAQPTATTASGHHQPSNFIVISFCEQSRGALLYGKPGTGKTHLAKAVAKEAGAVFINLNFQTILSKYLGESQKLVAAAFSLANKLQPAIIFVDEVDGLLSQRHSVDHSMDNLKAVFLTSWEGFDTDGESRVTVLAATNHKDKLDKAVLRRFGTMLEVPLPDIKQRVSILQVILKASKNTFHWKQGATLMTASFSPFGSSYSCLCAGPDVISVAPGPLSAFTQITATRHDVLDDANVALNLYRIARQCKNYSGSDLRVTLRKLQQSDFDKVIYERKYPNKERFATVSYSSSANPAVLLPSPSSKLQQIGVDEFHGMSKSPTLCKCATSQLGVRLPTPSHSTLIPRRKVCIDCLL
eukprot:SM000081S22622  [mRNA]  locus=s81:122629:125325:- [translate_table: standard]